MTNETERQRIAREGMYRPEFESDACGVGLVAATDGKPNRRVVAPVIDALKAVLHCGALDSDGQTGEGAGIHVDLRLSFLDYAIAHAGRMYLPNRLALGMVDPTSAQLGT